MADISFNIACKELKIAQIAQLNQLFQRLHLVYIYGNGFFELSRMLMRKNVDNDVSKDSPIAVVHVLSVHNTIILLIRYTRISLIVSQMVRNVKHSQF